MKTLKEASKEIGMTYLSLWKRHNRGTIKTSIYKGQICIDDMEISRIKEELATKEYLQSVNKKKCKLCKKYDSPDNFKYNENICLECDKKRSRVYYKNNKEKCIITCTKWARKNKEKVKEIKNKSRKKYREKILIRKKIDRYNISEKDYIKMLEVSRNRCTICDNGNCRLCVDHNHTTGKVRGLLCVECNFAIGCMSDNISIINSAIIYLSKSDRYNIKYSRNQKYDLIIQENHNTCNICNNTYQKMCIDHNHTSGDIRGLLCDKCNVGIAKFKENVITMQNAILYLDYNRG